MVFILVGRGLQSTMADMVLVMAITVTTDIAVVMGMVLATIMATMAIPPTTMVMAMARSFIMAMHTITDDNAWLKAFQSLVLRL